ncbi:COG1470 family protein, partial [Thermococcus sp.]
MTKWAKGILLIFLIVGFTLAGAVSYTPVAAATNDDSVYETFWSILNREAELVAKLNVTNNTSVANELVKNSQLGAQNAVNISALVWNALEELQKSGVKMYYSPEELRKMAQNISKNGLPKETVQSLKSQGWTDEEINELEEYIAKNADNITSGFNMSTFLQNFSLAFVRVGFKYTYYESWGLYKAFWEGKEKTVKRPTNYTTLINPLLSQDWLNLYKAYTAGDVDKELSSASALSSKMMGLFKSRTGVKDVLKLITRNNDKLLLTSKYKVSRVTHLTDGGLLIYASHEGISKQALSVEYLDKYYWWNALRAYRTLREIQVILGAMKKGNTDPRLRAMLNQKMAQLKDELIVDCVETSTPIRILPNPGPVPIPKPPVSAETRSASLPSAQSTKVSTNKATQLEIFALSPNTNYGYIDNLQVTLEKSVLANGQLEYHIHVSFAVEKNALSNVTVKLSDSRGSDSVHYSVLQVGSQSWDSKSFTTSERILNPGDSVTITGTVTITYTAMDTPTPTSTNSGSEIAGGPKKGEISTSYSFTVTYDDLMQDSRVHIQVIPEPSSITTDQSVTFQLVITNNNPVPIYGHWEADIYVPSQKDGNPHPLPPISGNVEVYPGKTETVTVATITYVRAGDYNYSVTFSFGSSNNKKVQGIIHVKGDSGPAGSLEIKNVTPSPPSPKSGDVVNFTVKVRNAYLTKKDVEVKLFIDDKFADETGGSIPATS